MLEAGSLTEPEEAAVFQVVPLQAGSLQALLPQKVRRPELVHPGVGLLAQDPLRLAGVRIGPVQVEEGLPAVLDLIPDVAAGRERDVDEQDLGVPVDPWVDPGDVSSRGRRDAEPDAGIRVAGLRVGVDLERRPVGHVVDDREAGHVPLVGLQERNPPAVRTPPVRLVVAAAVDLLLVDPVELAVQRVLSAARGQPDFVAGDEVHDVEIRVAYEREAATIRREAGQFLGFRTVGEPRQRLGVEVPDEQVRGELEQEPIGRRRQAQRRRSRLGSGVLIVQPESFFQGLRQGLGVVERLRVSGRRVDEAP